MILIDADRYRRMPWKNGGGTTIEIAVSPEGADLDRFDWRVSMAEIETAGPFSAFPGIERVIALIEGQGLALAIGDAAPVILERGSTPYTFAADLPAMGTPIGGPVRDLNVMTRRGRYRAAVERVAGAGPVARRGTVSLILALGGGRLWSSLDIPAGATVLFEPDDAGSFDIAPAGEGETFLIELFRC